jgi:hypothetical protein
VGGGEEESQKGGDVAHPHFCYGQEKRRLRECSECVLSGYGGRRLRLCRRSGGSGGGPRVLDHIVFKPWASTIFIRIWKELPDE